MSNTHSEAPLNTSSSDDTRDDGIPELVVYEVQMGAVGVEGSHVVRVPVTPCPPDADPVEHAKPFVGKMVEHMANMALTTRRLDVVQTAVDGDITVTHPCGTTERWGVTVQLVPTATAHRVEDAGPSEGNKAVLLVQQALMPCAEPDCEEFFASAEHVDDLDAFKAAALASGWERRGCPDNPGTHYLICPKCAAKEASTPKEEHEDWS